MTLTKEQLASMTAEAGGSFRGQFDLHQFTSSELMEFGRLWVAESQRQHNDRIEKAYKDLEG